MKSLLSATIVLSVLFLLNPSHSTAQPITSGCCSFEYSPCVWETRMDPVKRTSLTKCYASTTVFKGCNNLPQADCKVPIINGCEGRPEKDPKDPSKSCMMGKKWNQPTYSAGAICMNGDLNGASGVCMKTVMPQPPIVKPDINTNTFPKTY